MRLALKLSAGMVAGILLVLAAQSGHHLQRLDALQDDDRRRDAVAQAGMLAELVGALWSSVGRDRARSFVEHATRARDNVRIVLREQPVARTPVRDSGELVGDDRESRIREVGDWLVVSVPVKVGERTVGSLEVQRRGLSERALFQAGVQSQVVTSVAAALVASLIALVVGLALVGRPIAQLSQLAHRVAEGDFSQRSQVSQQDELGQLSQDLNAMADRLQASQTAFRSERHARTQALEQLRHADRLSTVGKLASSMAHELGTPLNVVSGRAMMLASDDGASVEARENGRIIAEQASRMTAIIRGLLDFARRRPLQLRETRVGDVVQHAVSLLEPICEEHDIAMLVYGDSEACARIDAGKTLQVLTNIMMNAIQAMPEGGTIALDVERLSVCDPPDRHASSGQYVRIGVADRGTGIPHERLAEIFLPFFTTKQTGQGTGLGLSVCHGIVREHGGWIDVNSELGEGSRFEVYLPEGEAA